MVLKVTGGGGRRPSEKREPCRGCPLVWNKIWNKWPKPCYKISVKYGSGTTCLEKRHVGMFNYEDNLPPGDRLLKGAAIMQPFHKSALSLHLHSRQTSGTSSPPRLTNSWYTLCAESVLRLSFNRFFTVRLSLLQLLKYHHLKWFGQLTSFYRWAY